MLLDEYIGGVAYVGGGMYFRGVVWEAPSFSPPLSLPSATPILSISHELARGGARGAGVRRVERVSPVRRAASHDTKHECTTRQNPTTIPSYKPIQACVTMQQVGY